MQTIRAVPLVTNPTEEQFHAVRRDLITGTDIATVLGLNPYSTAYSLALEKKGKLPPREESDATWVGKQLEPTILALFSRKMNRKVRPNRTIYAHPDHLWAGGTPDGFTDDDGPLEGIEAKAVGVQASFGWGEAGTEDVPVWYFTQVHWYSGICGGIPWNLIGLMGTKGQVHPIAPDADMFARLLAAGREFREKYLLTDDLPEPGAGDIETVARLFPRSQEAEMMETAEIRVLVEAYAKARVEKAAIELAEKDAKARLMVAMGEKSSLRGDDFRISWKNNKDSVRVDLEKAFDKALTKLPAKYADELQKIVAEFTRTVPGPRVFRPYGALFRGVD